ncbi:hypothetical protein GW17_00044322, partial [Ensete ventricosum]
SAVRALTPPVYPAGYLRRVGHVGGPAVRGCDDLAARSAFVISAAQGTEAGVAAAGSARPISMAERARLAKIPRPERPQIQQFPFLGGLEPPQPEPPAYHLNGEGVALAKIEDNSYELRLPRQCSGLLGTEQY